MSNEANMCSKRQSVYEVATISLSANYSTYLFRQHLCAGRSIMVLYKLYIIFIIIVRMTMGSEIVGVFVMEQI